MTTLPLKGQDDPVYQAWVLLLNGYGFNWYRLDNQMRADDLLIRAKASEHLAEAAAALRRQEAEFRRIHLPPPSREKPFPDPERLAELARLKRLQDRIATTDTKLRGAPVPADDKIWARHRDELDSLTRLVQFDTILVGTTHRIAEAANAAGDGMPADAVIVEIEADLAVLEELLHQRGELLAIR